jgi:hypothetical protein
MPLSPVVSIVVTTCFSWRQSVLPWHLSILPTLLAQLVLRTQARCKENAACSRLPLRGQAGREASTLSPHPPQPPPLLVSRALRPEFYMIVDDLDFCTSMKWDVF